MSLNEIYKIIKKEIFINLRQVNFWVTVVITVSFTSFILYIVYDSFGEVSRVIKEQGAENIAKYTKFVKVINEEMFPYLIIFIFVLFLWALMVNIFHYDKSKGVLSSILATPSDLMSVWAGKTLSAVFIILSINYIMFFILALATFIAYGNKITVFSINTLLFLFVVMPVFSCAIIGFLGWLYFIIENTVIINAIPIAFILIFPPVMYKLSKLYPLGISPMLLILSFSLILLAIAINLVKRLKKENIINSIS